MVADELLRGKNNCRQWMRDFKAAAASKGVDHIFDGRFLHRKQPDPANYGLSVKYFPGDDVVPSTEVEDTADTDWPDINIYGIADVFTAVKVTSTDSERLSFYKSAVDEYDKGQRLLSTAKSLLYDWIHPGLRIVLDDYDNPKEAYDFLIKQHNATDARAREAARNIFENAHISNFAKVQDYINTIQSACDDIKAANGTCDDGQVKDKIMRGLSDRFTPFITAVHLVEDMGTELSVDKLVAQLLTFESTQYALHAANVPKTVSTKNKARDRPREQCSHCNVWGHHESKCWHAHPELRPARAFTPTTSSAPSSNLRGQLQGFSDPKAAYDFLTNRSAVTDDPQFQFESMSISDLSTARGHAKAIKPAREEKAITPLCLAVFTSSVDRDSWILDSSATVHICNNPSWFSELVMYEHEIGTANRQINMSIMGGGTAPLSLSDGDGDEFVLRLRDVAYCPASRCNILSLSKLAKANIAGIWDAAGFRLLVNDHVVATTSLTNGHNHLNLFGKNS